MTRRLFLSAVAAAAAPLKLVAVNRIWGKSGVHSAFTDLIRYRNRWFCTFREGGGHASDTGEIRVLSSTDGARWESAALLAEPGIDLRDPKLSIAPDGRLMMNMGGSVRQQGKYVRRQCRVAFSANGSKWSRLDPVLDDNHWLWRVTWHKGTAYGFSYRGGGGLTEPRAAHLWSGRDGVHYDLITRLGLPGQNETTLRFDGDEMVALARSVAQSSIGVSLPPYRHWTWTPTGHALGGPNFIALPDGRWIAASRHYPQEKQPRTALAWLTRTSYEPALVFESSGDTSYPGLVFHDGLLWVSFYSSHEGFTAIYLAKVAV
jgi:hypothetical protein